MRNKRFVFAVLLLAACGDNASKLERELGPVGTLGDSGSDGAVPEGDAEVSQPIPQIDAGLDANLPEGDAATELDAGADAASDAGQDAAVVDAGHDAGPPPRDPKDVKLETDVNATLRACKIVSTTGLFNAGGVEDNYDRCIGKCIVGPLEQEGVANHCDVLYASNAFCGGVSNAYNDCTAKCTAPADGFKCADGKTVIPHIYVCDDGAFYNCPGAANDEADCAKFTCKDGDKISAKGRCDGLRLPAGSQESIFACKDQSDEVGCAKLCVK